MDHSLTPAQRNPKIFDPPITIEEFAQAYTWSMTRDFAVSGGTSDDRAAILPIADYINHSNGKETYASFGASTVTPGKTHSPFDTHTTTRGMHALAHSSRVPHSAAQCDAGRAG